MSLARIALRRPGAVLALVVLGTAVAASGLFRLELRTDGAAIYPTDDPAVLRTAADRATFREPDQLILLVTSRPGGPPVASPAGFRFLEQTQKALTALPAVDRQGIWSLVTLIEPPETLRPRRLATYLETWDGSDASFPSLLARIRKLPVASGLFLAASGRAAAFYLSAAGGASRSEMAGDLRRFVAARTAASTTPFALRVTGPVAAELELGEVVLADLARLVPIMVVAVALLLALCLRTPGGVLIPLAQVLATLVWTLGLMGWARVPITLVTTVLPVLLMAMAMTDEIYLLERIADHLAGRSIDRANVVQAAAAAFTDLTAPLVLISLATAAGFFSFLGASMAPLRHLGLFTGLGLLLGMLFTFTLAPALIALLPPSWIARRREARGQTLPYERFTARRPAAAALGLGLLLLLALPGLFRLRVQDSWIDNFDPRSPLVTAERRFNREFWGSYRYDVVLTGAPRVFWTPAGAALLADLHRWARGAPHVGGAWSVLPALESAAHARGDALPLSALPAPEVAKVGALAEILRLRINLDDILTFEGDQARLRLFVRDADYAKARVLQAAVAAKLTRRLPSRAGGVRWHASGDVPLALAVVGSIVGNQLRSIGWTALLIALSLLVALKSPRLAAVVLAPVLAATLLLFGLLGWAGIPLGIATSLFAALNLGAGVDFAVQYVYAYRRERRSGLAPGPAVERTLATTGRGLRWNAVVLALGIAVLALSAIKPNASLGLLLAAAMLVSYGATLALLPALLRRFGK
ncbi:MAG TPA: MMPL family transporter [Thermoanaerobaculia bacterium]|nr:MMPL family transporter [Thermoanaerobaculia bacterium]